MPATRFAQALRSMFPDIPFTQDMISALTKAFAARPDTAAAIQSSSNAAGQAVCVKSEGEKGRDKRRNKMKWVAMKPLSLDAVLVLSLPSITYNNFVDVPF